MDAAVVSGSDVPHDHYDSSSSEDDEILIGRKDALNGRGINHPRLSDILEDTDDGDDADGDVSNRRKYNIPQKDHLYNPDKDDEDEAYVYKHLRHGVEENVAIRRKKSNKKEEDTGNLYGNGTSMSQQKQQSNGSHPSSQQTKFQKQQQSSNAELPSSTAAANAAAFNLEQAKIFKPRSSDAVLSCPCCFQIVCMDCQRHERFTNQFRAMFVMNIDVRWDVHVDVDVDVDEGVDMKVNESARGEDMRNHGKSSRPNEGKSENGDESMSEMGSSVPTIPTTHHNEKKLVYHSVVCNSCQTEVAALDMRDEVYHFFGCLVSS